VVEQFSLRKLGLVGRNLRAEQHQVVDDRTFGISESPADSAWFNVFPADKDLTASAPQVTRAFDAVDCSAST
jgi:hypothetical protein